MTAEPSKNVRAIDLASAGGPPPRLSEALLTRFVSKYWDKRPVVLRAPFGVAAPRVEDVLPAVILTCEDARRGAPQVRLFLERQRRGSDEVFSALVSGPGDDLPGPSDASTQAYARRLRRAHRPSRFCLVVNDLQSHDWPLFLKLRPFLRDLCGRGIVPAGGSSINLLLGDYLRTPFGVHKDHLHVFTFVVEGSKRVLLWPLEAFADHPTVRDKGANLRDKGANVLLTAREYRDAAASAVVLEAEAGDLIYWPASYWHVVEGDGQLATTVSWDLRVAPSLMAPAAPVLGEKEIERRARIRPAGMKARGDWPLPSNVERLVAAAASAEAIARGRQAATVTWLQLTTGLGCVKPPPPAPFGPVEETCVVRGVPESPIAWARTSPSQCVFAANGHSMDMAADAGTLDRVCEVLAVLNRGRAVPVSELTARLTGARRASRGVMRDVLATLGSWHALERV